MRTWVSHPRGAVKLLALALVAWALLGVQQRYCVVLVDGRSMEPTLRDGEVLVVDRLAYRDAGPMRGEMVVARYRGELLVKRVVGLSGDIVEVREGLVWLNGYPSESPASGGGGMELRAGVLLRNQVALLGDNRSMHAGEHVHAVVDRRDILGRVVGGSGCGGRGAGLR